MAPAAIQVLAGGASTLPRAGAEESGMKRPVVAFVGSGGATKGIAHIGAWRAIEELGIDVEIFVGTSAGAIAGACFAQGLSSDDVVDWFRLPWNRRGSDPALRGRHFLGPPNLRQLVDPGYLTSGLFSIDPLERFLYVIDGGTLRA